MSFFPLRPKGTRIWILITLWAIFLVAGAGCGSKELKYPEDHARYQRGIQAIKTLETAYLNQDASAIHKLLLPLEPLQVLEAAIQQDFATFFSIQLDLTVDRILVDGDHLSAFISWQGTWRRTADDTPVEANGHGVLLWSGNQVILLRGTEGDIPFGITSRPDFLS